MRFVRQGAEEVLETADYGRAKGVIDRRGCREGYGGGVQEGVGWDQ